MTSTSSIVNPALGLANSSAPWLPFGTSKGGHNMDSGAIVDVTGHLPLAPGASWSSEYSASPSKPRTRRSTRTARLSTSSIEVDPLPAPPRQKKRTRSSKKAKPKIKIEELEEIEDVDDGNAAEAEDEEGEEEEEEEEDHSSAGSGSKRNRLLERNRVAASKCRQKKKVWVHDLEEAKTDLESQHSHLQLEYNELLDEVNQMKNHLMVHANCNDGNIDRWIGTEAHKFVERVTLRRQREEEEGVEGDGGMQGFQGYQGFQDGRRISGSSSELFDGSFVQTPPSFGASLPSSPQVKFEPINFDHMPDEMFEDVSPGHCESD